LPRCIRVLLHFYTTHPPGELKHMYLREAAKLRPDR
jgi:chorismate mutase